MQDKSYYIKQDAQSLNGPRREHYECMLIFPSKKIYFYIFIKNFCLVTFYIFSTFYYDIAMTILIDMIF